MNKVNSTCSVPFLYVLADQTMAPKCNTGREITLESMNFIIFRIKKVVFRCFKSDLSYLFSMLLAHKIFLVRYYKVVLFNQCTGQYREDITNTV